MQIKVWDTQDKADLYQELKRHQLPYKVNIEPIYQQRTDRENRYYWGVVIKTLCEFTGYYSHEMHNVLLIMFAKIGSDVDEYGREFHIVESTAGMSSIRKEKYLEDIRTYFLTDYKLRIPEIGEQFENDEVKEKIIYK